MSSAAGAPPSSPAFVGVDRTKFDSMKRRFFHTRRQGSVLARGAARERVHRMAVHRYSRETGRDLAGNGSVFVMEGMRRKASRSTGAAYLSPRELSAAAALLEITRDSRGGVTVETFGVLWHGWVRKKKKKKSCWVCVRWNKVARSWNRVTRCDVATKAHQHHGHRIPCFFNRPHSPRSLLASCRPPRRWPCPRRRPGAR